jgi:hypothetical protein
MRRAALFLGLLASVLSPLRATAQTPAAVPAATTTAPAAATVAATSTVDDASSCDIGQYPAATLLLPFFDVDFSASSATATNTIFTVINTTPNPQIARITLWTDRGFPGAWFNIFLTGYDTQTISLYEIFARGFFPPTTSFSVNGTASAANYANSSFLKPDPGCQGSGGGVPPALLERLQRVFTGGLRDDPVCAVSEVHAHATGSATIDVVNSCVTTSPLDPAYWNDVILYDNVLTGDYERVNPNTTTGNYAGGNPLVHIRAIPGGGNAGTAVATPLPYTFYDRFTPAANRRLDRRQPLPAAFAARYIQGGPGGFNTSLAIWREPVTGLIKTECAYEANAHVPYKPETWVRFDEHENPTAISRSCNDCAAGSTTPSVLLLSTASSSLPPSSTSGDAAGWFWLNLDNGIGRTASNPYSTPRASQNWIVIQMYAEGRFGVDFDATSITNGCAQPPSTMP